MIKLIATFVTLSFVLVASEAPAGKAEQNFTPVSLSMKVALQTSVSGSTDPNCDPCQSCTNIIDAMMCGLGWNYGCYVACPICPDEAMLARIMLKSLPVRIIPFMLPDLEVSEVR